LFSNDPEEWFAVPMDLISRVERIRSEQIEHVGGQMVIAYRGGSLPIVSLENHIKARPRHESPRLYVAVYNVHRREVGLVVPNLVDIRRLQNSIDTATLREPGVVGSLVVEGRPVRLLDLSELTRLARPDWFEQSALASERRPVIMLAEDSPFFRNQLLNYLASEKFEVEAFSDGKAAWERLQADPKRFALVVTDVEMPRMNGLELTRRIRNEPSLAHLPVVAVTSLSSEEDIERGKAAGVNEYLFKLERDRLLVCVNQLLSNAESTPHWASV
jgi:two-component system chemotaxis sensor kinase CheA